MKSIPVFFVLLSLTQGLLQKSYQRANTNFYEIQEITDTLNSSLQCSMYCSQSECCEGTKFNEIKNCKLLKNIHLSSNTTDNRAWVNSDIVKRGTKLDKILIFNGDPAVESMVTELVDFKVEENFMD